MTLHAPFIRLIPWLLLVGAAVVSLLLNFNGLYGQDAHEYLRQSKALLANWETGASVPLTLGNSEFACGYPLVGAAVGYVIADPILALQVVSWLSFAMGAWVFERILNLLAHGSRADSRWVFVVLGLILSPVFLRAGLTAMSDSLGLLLALVAVYLALKWIEQAQVKDAMFAAVIIPLAVAVRFALAGLMIPLALVVGWSMWQRQRWFWILAAVVAGLIAWVPQFLLGPEKLFLPLQHSNLHWSLEHFFSRDFNFENGHFHYLFPNLLYLAFPLMHYGFCLPLPGLLLLAKMTDLALPTKKALLICLAAYLFLLGGLPLQNLRFLLPAYALLLLLIFPAWDRMYCYGFYFFKRLTWSILGATLLLQIIGNYLILRHPVQRNHLEQSVAAGIKPYVKPGQVIYSFDLDVAMKTYQPEVQWINLWESRIDSFRPSSLVLFNETGLREQWAGKNPMLNWDALQAGYRLELLQVLPDGWCLYLINEAF